MKFAWVLIAACSFPLFAGRDSDFCGAARLPSADQINIRPVVVTLKIDDGAVSEVVTRPSISGTIYADGEIAFNGRISEELARMKENFTEPENDRGWRLERQSGEAEDTCVVQPVDGRFLTVRCGNHSAGFGGRENYSTRVDTIDLSTGREMRLWDMAIPATFLSARRDEVCKDKKYKTESDSCDARPLCCGPHLDTDERGIVLGVNGISITQEVGNSRYTAAECPESGETDFSYEELQKVLPADSPLKPFVDMIVKIPVASRFIPATKSGAQSPPEQESGAEGGQRDGAFRQAPCPREPLVATRQPPAIRREDRLFSSIDGRGRVLLRGGLVESAAYPKQAAAFNAWLRAELGKRAGGLTSAPDPKDKRPVSYTARCAVTPATGRFLSVSCMTTNDPPGNPDPTPLTRREFTWDLQTGKRVTMGDLHLPRPSLAKLVRSEGDGTDFDANEMEVIEASDLRLDRFVLYRVTGQQPSDTAACVASGIGYAALLPLMPESSPLYGVVAMQARAFPGRTHGEITIRSQSLAVRSADEDFSYQWDNFHGSMYDEAENKFNAENAGAAWAEMNESLSLADEQRGATPSCSGESSNSSEVAFGRFITRHEAASGYCGGAHPDHGSSVNTYDLKQRRGVYFNELFKSLPEARAAAARAAFAEAESEQEADYLAAGEMARKWLDETDYPIGLTESGVRIQVPRYCHICPELEFEMPWAELVSFLDPAGPLGPFIPEIRASRRIH